MKPTALVIGASGFLGNHLVKALRRAGYPVVAWVRTPLAHEPDAGLTTEPWPGVEAFAQAIARLERPVVFHLAAAADRAARNPGLQFESNVVLTAKLIQACASAGVRGFVHAGSCAEYERVPEGVPITEATAPGAVDLYGASKAASGLWAQAVARYGGFGFVWARLFALYGPGLRPPRLLPTVHAALRGKRPVDLTPGTQIQDWLYVEDAAAGLVHLGDYAAQGRHATINLCTGKARSTRDFVTMFAQRMNEDLGLLRFGGLPARQDEPRWLVGDPAAAQKLGWSARTEIGAGLDATIAAFDRQRHDRREAQACPNNVS